ncbi:MAG: hypothetical protein WEC84_03465 [Candidatus Andersenbacteria bacterium]
MNPYPIVDGAVFAKIYRTDDGAATENPGPRDLVDQYFIQRDVTLAAEESKPISHTWRVPAHLPTGDYQLATYFVNGDAFNLSGLSFTDDIVGEITPFHVTGEAGESVAFNRATATVNTEPYRFVSFAPQVEGEATFSIDLVNPTSESQTIPVTWQLYTWDSLRQSNLLDTTRETVTVGANASQTVSYTTSQNAHAIYYLVGTAEYEDTKSIVGMRVTRPDVEQVRINFPGVTSFPLTAGAENTLFSCIHGAGVQDVVSNNILTLTLTGPGGNVIHSYTYEGDITGGMMGVADVFTPNQTYDRFTLSAELQHNGVIVDRAAMEYDCSEIDPALCSSSAGSSAGPDSDAPSGRTLLMAGIGALVLILILAIAAMVTRKRATLMILGLLVAGAGLVFGSAEVAEAKSIKWNHSVDALYSRNMVKDGGPLDTGDVVLYTQAFHGVVMDATYRVGIRNLTTGAYLDVRTDNPPVVQPGDRLEFQFGKHLREDATWSGTGYGNDTPLGLWRNDSPTPALIPSDPNLANHPHYNFRYAASCPHGDALLNVRYRAEFDYIYDRCVHYVIPAPTRTFSSTDGMLTNCVDTVTGTNTAERKPGWNRTCTVAREGRIDGNFHFNTTNARFYSRWRIRSDNYSLQNIWWGNNIPMYVGIGSNKQQLFPIPAQTVPFALQAGDPGNPPSAPIVSGPTTGFINTSYPFTFYSVEAETDVQYHIDWTGDGQMNEIVPADQFVPVNVQQSSNKTWPSVGDKTLYVRAVDEEGRTSDWTSHTITIDTRPPNVNVTTGPGPFIRNSTVTATGTVTHPDNLNIITCEWLVESPGGTTVLADVTAGDPGSIEFVASEIGQYDISLICTDENSKQGEGSASVVTQIPAFDPGGVRETD